MYKFLNQIKRQNKGSMKKGRRKEQNKKKQEGEEEEEAEEHVHDKKWDARNPILNLFLLISPNPMDQQGSPCCCNFLTVTSSCHSKVNLFGPQEAAKLAEEGFLFLSVFNIGFPSSLLRISKTLKKKKQNYIFCPVQRATLSANDKLSLSHYVKTFHLRGNFY